MTQINSYLTFDGNCREAMNFYRQCLGGDLQIMTVGETPVCDEMPPDSKDSVMHAFLKSDGMVLMASDCIGPQGYTVGNNVSLSLQCSSEEEIHRFFDALSAGGAVIMPVDTQFWGALFGCLTDKFGINWLLNYELPKSE